MTTYVLIGLLAFTTVFFGGVHVWSRSLLILAILGFSAVRLFTARKEIGGKEIGALSPYFMWEPGTALGIFFMLWALVHLIPLPPAVVAFLSPEAARLWSIVLPADASYRLSLYPFMTLDTLLFILAILLYYRTALQGLGERRQLERVVLAILVLGVAESLYGLIQLAAGRNNILWWENPFSGNVVTGTFINRNHLAAFLAMSICLGIGYLWSLVRQEREERHRRRHRPRLRERVNRWAGIVGFRGILVALALALMLAALLGSASRGGAISLVCGILFMLGLILARYFRTRRGFALMVVLTLVLSYTGYVAVDRLADRLIAISLDWESRLALARDAWKMGEAFPLTGSGPGTFEFVFPRYQNVELDKIVDHAHNDWVQLAAEYGWPGLLAVLVALAAYLVTAIVRWRRRHDGFVVGIGIGGIGALVAIAVHSLSDFNLHIPANPLLLALILAATWRALRLPRHDEEESEKQAVSQGFIGIRAVAGRAALLVLLAVAAFFVFQTWRADGLARTFQNSTVDFREPAPEKLRQARLLTPGNATYWLWTAERLRRKPNEKEALLTPAELRLPDPALSLLAEGLRKNPTSWQTWRETAWVHFFRDGGSGKGREAEMGRVAELGRGADLRRAHKSIEMASSLRPADSKLQMEKGTIALAAYSLKPPAASAGDWQDPFRQVARQNPRLAATIADLVVLHLGARGAYALAGFLPPDTDSHLNAAVFLLNRGYPDAGMNLFRRGEKERVEQIAQLWEEVQRTGGGTKAKSAALLRKVAELDPRHPGLLLMRGQTVQALQSMERRGEPVGKWQHVRTLMGRLEEEREAKKGDPVLQAYYLGLLAKAAGDQAKAVWWMNHTLSLNSQYFPAWLELRGLLKGQVRSQADRIQLDALESKIHLYAMDRIVFDAWRWAGKRAGRPTWSAPFRVAEKVDKAVIHFSGPRGTAWALEVDGRFVEIWRGAAWEGAVALAIPPGEHEFRLSTWSQELSGEGKDLPFRLAIQLK